MLAIQMELPTLFEISDFKFQVYLFPLGGVIFIVLASLMVRFPEKYIKFQSFSKSYIPPHILEVKKETT